VYLADVDKRWSSAEAGPALGVGLWGWDKGLDLADADRAIEAAHRAAATPGERWLSYYARAVLEFNRGRPRRALAAADTGISDPAALAKVQLVASLLWDADSALGEAAFRRLGPMTEAAPAGSPGLREEQYDRLFWVEAWRLAHRDTRTTARTVTRLNAAAPPADSATTIEANAVRSAILEAWLALVRGSDPRPHLEVADSLVRRVPFYMMDKIDLPENLIIARLFAARDDNERALAAVRRRMFPLSDQGSLLSSYLREEGRLASLTGDRPGAIEAYSRYLSMRSDPEPELRGKVAEVRGEVAKLVAEPEGQ
jgi:hypothetical protein